MMLAPSVPWSIAIVQPRSSSSLQSLPERHPCLPPLDDPRLAELEQRDEREAEETAAEDGPGQGEDHTKRDVHSGEPFLGGPLI